MKAFVITRDRAAYAQRCLSELLTAGCEPVVVDMGSTWAAALSWMTGLEQDGIRVLRRGGGHPRDLWGWEPFRQACGPDRYIVTDCDVIPSGDCPPDWPEHLSALLDEFPGVSKAALFLRTDNIPGYYQRRDQVITWEAPFWQSPVNGGRAFLAPADTTLAVYRPLAERPDFDLGSALRSGYPYTADHLAWHEDLDNLPPEITYYYEHAEPGIAHWAPSGFSNWGD